MRTILLALLVLPRLVAAQETPSEIDKLSWLKGCWGSDRDGRQITEHWLAPSGKTMLGISRTVAGGKTEEFEFMQIREDEEGKLSFIAKPSGQAETTFRLLRVAEREAVFENSAHDFPQRVIYRLKGDGSLLGRIEGMSKGKEKAVEFPMQRIRCDQ